MSKSRDNVLEDFYVPFWRMQRRQLNNPAEITVEYIQAMIERIVGELCINRFNWKGLPDSVDTRYVELSLYNYALVLIFEDAITGKLLALRANPVGGYDMNQNPIAYKLVPTPNGTLPQHLNNVTLSARNCVPVWANAFRIPDHDVVMFYASRIAQNERTIDINLMSARRTKIMAVNENSRLSAENINRMLDNGDAVIPVNIDMATLSDMIAAIDLGVHPEHIERLSIVRDRFWNNLMGLLGINNANQDKKERLVESEVSGNDDQIGNFRRINLNWRQKAADAINKKYAHLLGEEFVSVEYHTDIDPSRPIFPDETQMVPGTAEEGVSNASVHPGTMASA